MTSRSKTNGSRAAKTVLIPLYRLKKSPDNARRTPHSEAAIAALAASIRHKGLLQNLIVQTERNAAGEPTGFYLVTAGEGRRLAQRLRAKRKEIARDEPTRCIVDDAQDAHEISLDENVTRSAMHPADQFEAFHRLATEREWGPEEIGARFGVTAHVVRQRLRLASVSPCLRQAYREDVLSLDQLMAFAVTEDMTRQEQVFDQLRHWNRDPHTIRRALMESHVPFSDRRVRFVGIEAYEAAGGIVHRDLFAEEGAGWLDDPALLDRLVLEKLGVRAATLREDGWNWVECALGQASAANYRRIRPMERDLSAKETKRLARLGAKLDRLTEDSDEDDADSHAEIERLAGEIEAIEAQRFGFDVYAKSMSGILLSLDYDGEITLDLGLVKTEDEAACLPPANGHDATATKTGRIPNTMSDALQRDLAAHRALGLRVALAAQPDTAICAAVCAMVASLFYHGVEACLDLKARSSRLDHHAPGIEETPAARAFAEQHAAWAARLPGDAQALWTTVQAFSPEARLSLFAHCVALAVRPAAPADEALNAETLAQGVALDMTRHWTATTASYLGRVSKNLIVEAVREGVTAQAADNIATMRKGPMAEAAARLLDGRGWLPTPLRTPAMASAAS